MVCNAQNYLMPRVGYTTAPPWLLDAVQASWAGFNALNAENDQATSLKCSYMSVVGSFSKAHA